MFEWEKVMQNNRSCLVYRIGTLMLFSLFISNVAAEPVASLPMFNHVGEQLMASGNRTRDDVARDIPSREEVGLPVYAGVFYSGTIQAEQMMPAIVLASGDPIETVMAWYESQSGLGYNDEFAVFYVGDEYVMKESESIYLQDISENPSGSVGGMVFDMDGMKTQITISYKPKTGNDDE
jgi:hypothetical protein